MSWDRAWTALGRCWDESDVAIFSCIEPCRRSWTPQGATVGSARHVRVARPLGCAPGCVTGRGRRARSVPPWRSSNPVAWRASPAPGGRRSRPRPRPRGHRGGERVPARPHQWPLARPGQRCHTGHGARCRPGVGRYRASAPGPGASLGPGRPAHQFGSPGAEHGLFAGRHRAEHGAGVRLWRPEGGAHHGALRRLACGDVVRRPRRHRHAGPVEARRAVEGGVPGCTRSGPLRRGARACGRRASNGTASPWPASTG